MTEERYLRQNFLLSPAMKNATVIQVGAGMLGSWMVNSLGRTVNRVVLYDFDTVGPENIGTQAFDVASVGVLKVEALHLDGLPVQMVPEAFPVGEDIDDILPWYDRANKVVLVSCVDNFETRKLLAYWAQDNHVDLFVDTRAHANVGVVYTVKYQDLDAYIEELENTPPPPPAACGTEGTAYVGMWVASRATGSINLALQGLPTAFKLVHDVSMGEDLELALNASDVTLREGGIPVR